MIPVSFRPFETAAYPCLMLTRDGGLYMNQAARSAAPPISDSAAMGYLLRNAARKMENAPSATTLPLLTDALKMRQLTLMPVEDGLLAVAQYEGQAPAHAFSAQLREPITNIFAMLPLISNQIESGDVRNVEMVQANCYHLLRLTSNLENALYIEGKHFNVEVLDLAAMVDSLCTSVQSVCRDLGVPIRWQVPQLPVPVRGSRRLLSEALLNLIRNSLQYTRDGNELEIKLSEVGGKAVLTVEDRGLGIKPEMLTEVFEPYISADPYGDSNLRPGVGLGLGVVRQAVLGHGGTVNIESRFGEGTRVILALPLEENAANLVESEPADYLLNRYSPVYVQLCGYCRLPSP